MATHSRFSSSAPTSFRPERRAASAKPTDRQALALRALAEVVLTRGQDPPPSYQLPLGIKVVTLKDWEEELYRENTLDRDDRMVRTRFKELRESLAARCLIGMRDMWVWSAARPI